ncbi:MAG: NGG1p interacting factor NIF3 [Syntrophomonadaceae bacterium]|nr:NGG1p interacting factor NIF3 [Syntrophomonadaceae bacterium]
MKLRQIYELAVEMGKRNDIRGEYINRLLEEKQKEYDTLPDAEKLFFDRETLTNPYSDTRMLVGSGEEEIKTVMCGIDIETPEIILADRLNQKGQKIDMVLAHHPEGIAYAALYDVMHVQADMMEKAGVPINIGEALMAERISEVRRTIMPMNHQRSVDAARLLDIPFMCVHSPADNLVDNFLRLKFEEEEYLTLQDVLDILHSIPEYKKAVELKAGPRIIIGDKHQRAGKIFIKMTGGTSGSEKAYEKMAAAGVGTIIGMHMQEKHREAAKANNINVIIAGHMASDSLGMNLFLDQLEKEKINIIPCSGLLRVARGKQHELH